jgi:hypothetical protein
MGALRASLDANSSNSAAKVRKEPKRAEDAKPRKSARR